MAVLHALYISKSSTAPPKLKLAGIRYPDTQASSIQVLGKDTGLPLQACSPYYKLQSWAESRTPATASPAGLCTFTVTWIRSSITASWSIIADFMFLPDQKIVVVEIACLCSSLAKS